MRRFMRVLAQYMGIVCVMLAVTAMGHVMEARKWEAWMREKDRMVNVDRVRLFRMVRELRKEREDARAGTDKIKDDTDNGNKRNGNGAKQGEEESTWGSVMGWETENGGRKVAVRLVQEGG
jgi:hypothetical protein